MTNKTPSPTKPTSDTTIEHVSTTIESQVLVIRGQRVLLAQQLAALYSVEVKALNQAVQRNIVRFPVDFMFRLQLEDMSALRSQTVTLNAQVLDSNEFLISAGLVKTRGGNAKYLPYAFTEQGVAMLSSVLKSERAIAVNVEIMRTFVKLRGMLSEHVDMKQKLKALEKKYDENFKVVFDAIHQLMTPTELPKKKRIGFIQD
jgi:ORF6N domain